MAKCEICGKGVTSESRYHTHTEEQTELGSQM